MTTRNWNEARAKKRMDDKIAALPLKDIEIKDYVRDTDLAPGEIYAGLMQVIRRRLDTIQILQTTQGDEFSRTESAAFQRRKVIEGITFACL